MMFPQTKEGMDLMDKVIWDYIMQRADSNNISFVEHQWNNLWVGGSWNTHVGGLTAKVDEDTLKKSMGESYDPRELIYPNNGEVNLVNPWTGKRIDSYGRGTIMRPLEMISYKHARVRYFCRNSQRIKQPGSYWFDRHIPLCYTRSIDTKEGGNPICVFSKKPTFRKAPIQIYKSI